MKTTTTSYFFKKIFKNHDIYIWMGLLLAFCFVLINIPSSVSQVLNQNHQQINKSKLDFDNVVTFESVTTNKNIEDIAKKYNFNYEQVKRKTFVQNYSDKKLNVEFDIWNQDHNLKNQKFLISLGRNIKNNQEVLIQPQLLSKLNLNIGDFLNVNDNYLKIVGTYVNVGSIVKNTQSLNDENNLKSQIVVNDFTFKQLPAPISNLTYVKFNQKLSTTQKKQVFEKLKNDLDFSLSEQISLFKYKVDNVKYKDEYLCDNKDKVNDMHKWGQMSESDFETLKDIATNKNDINNCLKEDSYLKTTKTELEKINSSINNVKTYLTQKKDNAQIKDIEKLSSEQILNDLKDNKINSDFTFTFNQNGKDQNISDDVSGQYLQKVDNKLVLQLSKLNQVFQDELNKINDDILNSGKVFNATIRIPNGYQTKYFTLLKNYQEFNKDEASSVLLKEKQFLITFITTITLVLVVLVIIMLILIINKIIRENLQQIKIFKQIGFTSFKLSKAFLSISVFISLYYLIWTLLINSYITNFFKWYLSSKYNLINYNIVINNFTPKLLVTFASIFVSILLICVITITWKFKNVLKVNVTVSKNISKMRSNFVKVLWKNKFTSFTSIILVFIVTTFFTIITLVFVNLNQNFATTNQNAKDPILNVYDNGKYTNLNAYTTKYEIANVISKNKTTQSDLTQDVKSLQILAFSKPEQTIIDFNLLNKGLVLPKSYENKYNLKVNQQLELNTTNGLKKFNISGFSSKLNDKFVYTNKNYLKSVFLTNIENNSKLAQTVDKLSMKSIDFKALSKDDENVLNSLTINLLIATFVIILMINPLISILKQTLLTSKYNDVRVLKLIGLPTSKIVNYIYKPQYILTLITALIAIIVSQYFFAHIIIKLIFELLGYEITYVDSIFAQMWVVVIIMLLFISQHLLNVWTINKISKKLLQKGI